MTKIALEGPINACSDAEANDWREEAMRLLHGFKFHNPMDFDARGKEDELEQAIIDYDTAGMSSSDALLVMAERPGWGTAMAVQMGYGWGKVIVVVCSSDRPSPWLKSRATVVLPTLRSACAWIRARFRGSRPDR